MRVPGLVDIHVHGVRGLDVMSGETNHIVAELRSLGIEWCCPTTVTDSSDSIQKALSAIDPSTPGFAGVHLEGPFISRQHPGAQPSRHIRDNASVSSYLDLLGEFESLIRIVTLAPEVDGARQLIGHLGKEGKIASAGHTDATYALLNETEHLSHVTHCFNAMRPFHHREPGTVGYALLSDSYCELIYDRVHVDRAAAELLLKLKLDKVIAISDGTAAAEMADGWESNLWGQEVQLREGSLRLKDGTLAGSAVTLAGVFKCLWQDFGPKVAVSACSVNPRRALGLPEPAMWLEVDDDGTIIEVLED